MAGKKPKKPASLVETSTEEMRPALTAENFHEHPDTPSDQLGSFVTNYIGGEHLADAPEHDIAAAVAKHPNLPTASITDLYNHAVGPNVNNDFPEGKFKKPRGTHGEVIENLLQHKNAAPSIAENFLQSTANSGDYGTMDTHALAASHPGVSQEFLKNLVNQTLAEGEGSDNQNRKWKGYKLPASFHQELLASRGSFEPEEGQMTEDQKANNNRIRKLDQFIYGSYPRAKHDEQSLKRATEFYGSHEPTDKSDFQESRQEFVQNQPKLSGNDLEAIATKAKERKDMTPELMESIYNHPNVSPAFIAKQATSDEGGEDDWRNRDMRDKAISSPKLPEETRQKLIRDLNPEEMSHWGNSSRVANALLDNENLPAADIEAIFKKGKIEAMYHPNAPEKLVRDYYAAGDHNADRTRAALKAPNLPKDILSDIVKTNKNQAISIEALHHPNADLSVIDTGLKRKAQQVQDAAARHPLVIKQQLAKRLEEGKLKASDFISGVRGQFKPLTGLDEQNAKEIYGIINRRYKDESDKAITDMGETPETFWGVKSHLALAENVPDAIKRQNQKALADKFEAIAPEIFNEDQDRKPVIGNDIRNAAIKMADSGSSYAQEKWLKHPDQLNQLDLNNTNYGQDYLTRAATALQNEETKLPRQRDDVREDYKIKYKRDRINSAKKDIVLNPHVEDDVFNKIAVSPKFLDEKDNWSHPDRRNSYYGNKDKPSQYHTIFDSKWGSQPDAIKALNYAKLLEAGGQEAIVNSRTAPTDIFLKSMQQLRDQQDWFKENNITHYGDENLQQNALYGRLPLTDYSNRSAQVDVLAGLDPSADEDHKKLETFLAAPGDGEIRNDPGQVINAINPVFFQGMDSEPLIGNILQHGNEDEGLRAALVHASSLPKEKGAEYLQNLVTTAPSAIIDRDPTEQLLERWNKILTAVDEGTDRRGTTVNPVLRNIGVENHVANGKFDFLMNLPSQPPYSELASQIRAKAIKQGLISKQAQAQEVANNPTALSDALSSSIPRHEKSKIIRDIIESSQAPSDAILNILAQKSDITTLNPYAHSGYIPAYERARFDKNKQEELAKNYLSKYIDHSFNTKDGISQAAHFLHQVTGDDDKFSVRDGALTKDMRKSLISHFIKHVENSPLDTSKKAQYLLQAYNQFSLHDDEKMMPASLLTNISRNAIKSSDVPVMLRLVNSGYSSPGLVDAITKLSYTPGKLSDKDLISTTEMIGNDKTADAAANRIVKAAQDRIKALSAVNPNDTTAIALKQSLANNLIVAASLRNSSTMLDSAIKYVNDPHIGPDVQKQLSNHLDTQASSLDAKKIYNALPDNAVVNVHSLKNPPPSLVNDPASLEKASHGWRLSYLSSGIQAATTANVDILTNRVMNADENDYTFGKSRFMTYLNMAPNASPESVVKMFRSMPDHEQWNLLTSTGSPQNTNVHHLLPAALDTIDQQIATPVNGLPQFEVEHNDEIFNKLDPITNIISRGCRMDASADRQGAYADAMERVLSQTQKLYDGVMAKSKTDINNYKAWNDNYRNTSHNLAIFANRLSDREAPLKPDESMAVLGMIKNSRKLVDTLKENLPVHMRDNVETDKIAEALGTWVKNSEVKTEDWKNVFEEMPMAKFLISQRHSIDAGPLAAIDWKTFFDDKTIMEMAGSTLEHAKNIVDNLAGDGIPYARTIVEHATNSPNRDFQSFKYRDLILSAMDVSPSTFDKTLLSDIQTRLSSDKMPWREIKMKAVEKGVGGKEFLHDLLEEQKDYVVAGKQHWEALCKSPLLDTDSTKKLIDIANSALDDGATGSLEVIYQGLSANENLSSGSVTQILDAMANPTVNGILNDRVPYVSKKIIGNLAKNPNLDKQTYFKLYNSNKSEYDSKFQPGKKFHPAFINPKFGGELFRSLPLDAPALVGFTNHPSRLITEAEHSTSKDRLNAAMQMIPAEGIAWAQFKKMAPKMENYPEVKDVFMKKNNKPVVPEDIANAMKAHAGNNFHVTYSSWSGAQRHNPTQPNLVVQLNTSKDMEEKLSGDPKLWNFFQFIQKAANHIQNDEVGGHPVTPHLASWIRVDTSGGQDGWVIEEFQSDFDAGLESQIKNIKANHPDGFDIGGEHVTCDEMIEMRKKIEKAISAWHMASMKGMEELAKKQGVKNLYLHGEGVRATLSGMNAANENPIWLQEMYFKTPKALAWDKVDYEDYPSKSADFIKKVKDKGRPTYCWRKKIK